MVGYLKVLVMDDDAAYRDGNYTNLHEYARDVLNNELSVLGLDARVVSITEDCWNREVRPSQCNSSTWYTRWSLCLHVWYEYEPSKGGAGHDNEA